MDKSFADDMADQLTGFRISYEKGIPIVPDELFDQQDGQFRIDFPDHPYCSKVGAEESVTNRNIEVTHDIPMLSMSKLKNVSEAGKWYMKMVKITNNALLIIMGSMKLDGISCTLVYSNGQLVYGASRGDGKKGKIFDAITKEVNGVNHITKSGLFQVCPVTQVIKPFTGEIRGELIISKLNADKFEGTALRNICKGALTRNGPDTRFIDFIAFDMVVAGAPNMGLCTDRLGTLIGFGFKTTPFSLPMSGMDIINDFGAYERGGRNDYEYQTDGKVYKVNDASYHDMINELYSVTSTNAYDTCIKPQALGGVTPINDIEWVVSKHHNIVPTAILEPIMIGGVEIGRATLNNASYVTSIFAGISKGDEVKVIRANDVIPMITAITKSNGGERFELPKFCPSCASDTELDGVRLKCTSTACRGATSALIKAWVKKRKMMDFGGKAVEALVNTGTITRIADLYTVDIAKELAKFEGYTVNGKRIEKIMAAIEKSKNSITDLDIIACIGINGVGVRILENLGLTDITTLEKDVNIMVEDITGYETALRKMDEGENVTIPTSKYYGYKSAINRVDRYLTNNGIDELRDIKIAMGSKAAKLFMKNGTKIVITGTLPRSRTVISQELKELGYTIVGNVTRKVQYLVVGDLPKGVSNAKVDDARRHNIPMVSLDKFLL